MKPKPKKIKMWAAINADGKIMGVEYTKKMANLEMAQTLFGEKVVPVLITFI